jgi:hypothetical protein
MTYPRLHAIFFSSEASHLKSALRSVFGENVEEKMKEDNIDIALIPDWKSLELKITSDGLPEIIEEKAVTKLTLGFSVKKIPVVEANDYDFMINKSNSVKQLPASIDCQTTGQLIENSSEDTRIKSIELVSTIRDSSKVIESIMTKPFMEYEEIEHFKKWMKLV